MQGQIDLFTLLTMVIAVVAVFKLWSVLGRRTDDDDARIERKSRELDSRGTTEAYSEKVVSLPRRAQAAEAETGETRVTDAEVEDRIRTFARGNDSLATGLLAIQEIDRDFDPENFLTGARAAYEIIVTAFAEGSRKVLRDLLSKDVMEEFSAAIAARESRGERIEQSFVGIDKADILEAEVNKGIASITVRFASQLITATRDKAGNVIAGDPNVIAHVTDIWTFSRDISTARARQDPNWRLIATQDAH